MKLMLLVILPLLLFATLFAGGFDTLKKPRPTPVPTPRNTYIIDPDASAAPGSASQALQLNKPIFKKIDLPTEEQLEECEGQKLAVDLLLDSSGSMSDGGVKLPAMKQAVKEFGALLTPQDIVGMQSFSSIALGYTENARVLYPFGTYNQATFNPKVDGIVASGATFMREGFTKARSEISAAKAAHPSYYWVLIFLTDGIPTNGFNDNPSDTQNPTNIVGAMVTANEVDRVITVGLELQDLDSRFENYGSNLLKNLASSPEDFHNAHSASELQTIYDSIASSICR